MKRIIFLIIGGLFLFILLVGLVFGILIFMENSDDTKNEVESIEIVSEENNSVLGFLLDAKQVQIDSLLNLTQLFTDSISEFIEVNDSINKLNLSMAKQNKADSLKIFQLEQTNQKMQSDQQAKTAAANASTANVRELAKTYEQMKINEMKPIFAKLDDKTIIDLYNAMSARKKPLVLKALSTDRAAVITKKLAD